MPQLQSGLVLALALSLVGSTASAAANKPALPADYAPGRYNETSLHVATLMEQTERIELLLNAGVDPNDPKEADGDRGDGESGDGSTPLALAVSNGHVAGVKLLLAAGAKVNAVNRFGWSPLILAAYNAATPERASLVPMLLEAGADPALVCEGDEEAGGWEGKTAADLAREWGYAGTADLLDKAVREREGVAKSEL